SSERFSEFHRPVSWLVLQGASHCQQYVNLRITLVSGLDTTLPARWFFSLFRHEGSSSFCLSMPAAIWIGSSWAEEKTERKTIPPKWSGRSANSNPATCTWQPLTTQSSLTGEMHIGPPEQLPA
ncbi:MAG TPA: hypothetical protein VJY33_01835, partial [Isosphaeraceae bacterium]|nr:hypothetical protein [Isosphaeraceae bacterium]